MTGGSAYRWTSDDKSEIMLVEILADLCDTLYRSVVSTSKMFSIQDYGFGRSLIYSMFHYFVLDILDSREF